ncbi:MAG: hypothetical protein ACO1O6_09585 [Bacteroidota bacterium]
MFNESDYAARLKAYLDTLSPDSKKGVKEDKADSAEENGTSPNFNPSADKE